MVALRLLGTTAGPVWPIGQTTMIARTIHFPLLYVQSNVYFFPEIPFFLDSPKKVVIDGKPLILKEKSRWRYQTHEQVPDPLF